MIILILDNQADEYIDGKMFIQKLQVIYVENTKGKRQELL